jgi:predicted nucleic acid-binding protein
MMILVDISIWIDYFRGKDDRLVSHMWELLEDDRVALAVPVKIEILPRSSAKDRVALRRVLQALPLLMPLPSTWKRMETWAENAAAKGERFGVADLLIAALAADREIPLWSRDEDFKRMQRLGFIQLHVPV